MGRAEATAHTAGPEIGVVPDLDNAQLGMWSWLGAESVFFASLIGTFVVERGNLNGGPNLKQLIDLQLTFIGTTVLLTSSLTMALAFAEVQRGRLGAFRVWLIITVLLGLGFLGFQAVEFTGFYGHHFTYQTSPLSSAFFTLTGFHGMHVFFGAFWLVSLLVYSFNSHFDVERVTKVRSASLYWHFVDVVWVIIFSLVYLLGKVG